MKSKFLILLLIFIFFSGKIYSQQIFKNSIDNYLITLTKNDKQQFILKVNDRKKTLLNKTFPIIKLYFYNLDSKGQDEMIIVAGTIQNADTLNTLFVYTFEDKFKFCDSIYLGKYLPEFYQFNFDENYFIKIYDTEIENIFPASIPDLPFSFYYLNNCLLEFDNEFSFEEYEAEINYLVDQIYVLRKKLNCIDENLKKNFQRLLACLYVNIFNSGKAFDFQSFLIKNYQCDDKDELIKKINSIFENSEK